MKTAKLIPMAVIALSSMTFLSCKDKTVNEVEETNVEMAADTTVTTEPVPDTVPGVVSGAGDEQVP